MDAYDVRRRLIELDERLVTHVVPGHRLHVIVVGGAALMLSGLVGPERVTRDIDLVDMPGEAIRPSVGLDINNAADTFMYEMPSGWRPRLRETGLPTHAIEVLVPSPEDLAIMKLESGRARDLDDLSEMLSNDASLASKVDVVLENPLEVEINLDAKRWEEVIGRWQAAKRRLSRRTGTEPEGLSDEPHTPPWGDGEGGKRRHR